MRMNANVSSVSRTQNFQKLISYDDRVVAQRWCQREGGGNYCHLFDFLSAALFKQSPFVLKILKRFF